MKKLIISSSFLLAFLPLIGYAVAQQSPLDKVMEEAAVSGRTVEVTGEDGIIYRAFSDYGISKCRVVHGRAWKEGILVDSKIKEICNKDCELPVPSSPSHR